MKKLFNNKGSAMILVLCSLVILTAAGAVVIMLSTANITMSKKYSNWSSEYYALDYAAQERLAKLDKETLLPAEIVGRYYLQNSYYQYETINDFPSLSGTGAVLYSTLSPDDGKLQQLLYAKWLGIYTILLNGAADPADDDYQEEYDDAMEAFAKEVFSTLYYAQINQTLSENIADGDYTASNDIPTHIRLLAADWFPDVNLYSTFDEFYGQIAGLPQIEIIAKEPVETNAKQVEVLATVVEPSYLAVSQTKYIATMVNPLYTNAISTQGTITFSEPGNINIAGDVVSNNVGAGTDSLDEGNDAGIKTAPYTAPQVNIYGNVYSKGDLHLWGPGSAIRVKEYEDIPAGLSTSFSADLKDKLYENNYYYDLEYAGEGVNEYTEDYTADHIPFIYKDNNGGNVYCNSLSIEEGVTGGTLAVDGNVWTNDDIQNDGGSGSNITVANNYIGLRSDASEINQDPNASSSVINNAYLYGGSITIGGNYIIPGTAWYQFASVNTPTPAANPVYYQSAESVSAQAGEYFQPYIFRPGDNTANFDTYYVNDEEYYKLYNVYGTGANPLTPRINRFTAAVASLDGLKSSVRLDPTKDRYLLGTGIVEVGEDGVLVPDSSSSSNQNAYYTTNAEILPNSFAMKTSYYGTNGYNFSHLTNDAYRISDSLNHFYYYSSGGTIDIGAISSGIIYCNGNLHLTGPGTFRGSIICAGDLTVDAGVNIVYDESVVKSVLGVVDGSPTIDSDNGSRIARRFFSAPGFYMGQSLGTEQINMVSTTAGERESTGVQRYNINSWKEGPAAD